MNFNELEEKYIVPFGIEPDITDEEVDDEILLYNRELLRRYHTLNPVQKVLFLNWLDAESNYTRAAKVIGISSKTLRKSVASTLSVLRGGDDDAA